MSEDKQREVGYKVSSHLVFCVAGIPPRYCRRPDNSIVSQTHSI